MPKETSRLEALKEIRYGGKTYRTGDIFQAIDRDARVLKAIYRAKDAVEEDEPKSQPRSSTRAMTPEQPAASVEPMTTENTEAISPGRRYRRRDVTPEE